MNRKFEMIVTNRDSAIRQAEEFRNAKQSFLDVGFNIAQVEAMEREKNDEFEESNNAFWEAFKYPLEIFDLAEGDVPNIDEYVYVYDEIDGEFIRAQPSNQPIHGEMRFVVGLRVLGSPNDYARYTRWTRLPKLPEKK